MVEPLIILSIVLGVVTCGMFRAMMHYKHLYHAEVERISKQKNPREEYNRDEIPDFI